MSAIFISHSSKDSHLAKEVERRLAQRHHHSVFLDLDPEKGIVAGQSWERTLYRKLRACRAVVALCTDDYLRSHWCFAEIALARMEGKLIIALQAEPLGTDAKMPAILTERQFIDLRRNEEEGFRRLWRALGELDLLGVADDWDPREPPYLGLSAYQEEHAPVFFGREEESVAGIELLQRGAPGLIMVLGASGSGKSSLVRAGMLPRLRSREEEWLIVDPFRPGRDPLAELTESLVQGYSRYARQHVGEAGGRERMRERLRAGWNAPPPSVPVAAEPGGQEPPAAPADERLRRLLELLERLREDPPPPLTDRLRDYLEWSLDDLRRLCGGEPSRAGPRGEQASNPALVDVAHDLRRVSHRRDARVLLVVDQFEELLGREPAADEASRFLGLLRAAIEAERSPLTVLCTMRSDFLGLFQRHPALQGVDFESLSLGPMRIEGMRRVIEMPARLAAIELEDGLADRLLEDTETPDALPLLSFTLWVLCRDRREDGKLEVSEYEKLGGLQGTITREADAVLASASREHKEDDLRKALLQMARLGEDGSYVRLPVSWDRPEVRRVESILEKLVERRVLVSRLEGETRIVEVAHEALFRTWRPLRAWLDGARSELLLKQQLERDAAAWQEGGRLADHLWRGGRLLHARELMGKPDGRGAGVKVEPAVEFVRAGWRRRRLRRAVLAGTTTAVVAALAGFLAYALLQADRARKEKGRALDLARVSVAGDWLDKDPTTAALVLLDVEDPANTRFVPRRLSTVLSRGFVGAEFRHPGPVHSVAVSADGARVLTTSQKQAMVWEVRTGRLIRTLEHEGTVIAGSFDPTGRFVVTRSGQMGERDYGGDVIGNTAWVWEVATGQQRFAAKHNERLNSAEFSPNGQLLVTTSDDDTALLWDVESGRLRATLKHEDDVGGACFSPDGRLLLTVGGDAARLWAVETGDLVFPLGQGDSLQSASFSPDGAVAVTAAFGHVRTWDVKTGKALLDLAHDFARMASFSPDGRHLVTASDEDARVWDARTGSAMFEEPLQHANLMAASFSPDGSLVVTASGHRDRRGYGSPVADSAVRFWDARTGESRFVKELTHGHELMSVAFGPGGRFVVFSSADREGGGRGETLRQDATARLWDVQTPDRRLRRLLPQDSPVSSASFSPDGRRLLTVSGQAARLWNVETGERLADLNHEKDVNAASFAPDGKLVITAADDGTARLWDVETGAERFAARLPGSVARALLIANGTLLATLSTRTLRVWRVRSGTAEAGEALLEVADFGDELGGDSFSPDGKRVAVRSGETAQVWDLEARQPRFTLKHGGWVRRASFVAGGTRLVTAADEKVARVWDVQSGQPKFTLDHPERLSASAISPDGRTLLTFSDDGTGRLWDTDTGTLRFPLRHGCDVRGASFIAGGRLAVTWTGGGLMGACDAKVMLWDVATGQERATVGVDTKTVGFSPDGRLMFSVEGRGYTPEGQRRRAEAFVRIWDLDTGEERFAEPFESDDSIPTAAFSPDGRLLLAASGNGASIWAVGGDLLQSAIAAATTVCLKPEFRRQNLGESDSDARRKYEACEHAHGRP